MLETLHEMSRLLHVNSACSQSLGEDGTEVCKTREGASRLLPAEVVCGTRSRLCDFQLELGESSEAGTESGFLNEGAKLTQTVHDLCFTCGHIKQTQLV